MRSPKLLLLIALAAIAPLLLPGFFTFQLTQALALALALVGLNVLTGWAGQPSLGQGAFFAFGAYVVAVLAQTNIPWWLTLPAAALFGAAVAFLLGKPLLRLEHAYLALATFALALVTPQVLGFGGWQSWLGGSAGLQLGRPAPPDWMPVFITQDRWMYWIALFVATSASLSVAVLLRGQFGLDLRALRDNPVAAEACGIDVARMKNWAFVLSGACATLGGGLYALNVQLVTPDSFTLFLSLTMFIGLVIGGPATGAGPWFGALFIQFVPNWANSISTAAPWAIFGIAVMAIIFIDPRGLVGIWDRLVLKAKI